jgi:hypothetical protein
MNIKENSSQHLILTEASWWVPVTGIIIATFCFWSAATQMEQYPEINRLGAWIAGLVFLGVFTLPIRKIEIHFDRAAGTTTRTTEPLLPLSNINLFRLRSESHPIDSFLFAFLERQLRHNSTPSNDPQRNIFCLALATGEIPEDLLIGEIGFMNNPDKDKIRWLVGHNASMKRKEADAILSTVNRWLGTTIPQTTIE